MCLYKALSLVSVKSDVSLAVVRSGSIKRSLFHLCSFGHPGGRRVIWINGNFAPVGEDLVEAIAVVEPKTDRSHCVGAASFGGSASSLHGEDPKPVRKGSLSWPQAPFIQITRTALLRAGEKRVLPNW